MGIKDIKPGKYKAKAVRGKFGKSGEKGTPGVAIMFKFDRGDGNIEELSWTGWLTAGALERTIESLVTLGYLEERGHLTDGSIPETSFDPNVECEIVIELEDYTDKNGQPKTSPRINWVNKLGGAGFGLKTTESVTNMMAGIDLKKEMMVARQKLGLKKPETNVKNFAPQTSQSAPEPSFDNNDEIPF